MNNIYTAKQGMVSVTVIAENKKEVKKFLKDYYSIDYSDNKLKKFIDGFDIEKKRTAKKGIVHIYDYEDFYWQEAE